MKSHGQAQHILQAGSLSHTHTHWHWHCNEKRNVCLLLTWQAELCLCVFSYISVSAVSFSVWMFGSIANALQWPMCRQASGCRAVTGCGPWRTQQQDYSHAKLLCNKQPVKSATEPRGGSEGPVASALQRCCTYNEISGGDCHIIIPTVISVGLSGDTRHVMLTWHWNKVISPQLETEHRVTEPYTGICIDDGVCWSIHL